MYWSFFSSDILFKINCEICVYSTKQKRGESIKRSIKEILGIRMIQTFAFLVFLILCIIFFLLLTKSTLILSTQPFENLFSSTWNPRQNNFGYTPFIVGTAWVTGISMSISIPISLLSAVYISEYAPKRIKRIIRSFVDLLAGVPSVVYGLCGLLVIVPLVKDYIAPSFGEDSTGLSIFTAGVVLAIMVFPIIISLCIESFATVPHGLRESSLSLGASKWQMIKKVLLRASFPGIVAAVLLGFGRAFGETMAVLMLVGNKPTVHASLFGPASTIPSLVAGSYGDMQSIPIYESAILLAALVLFIIITLFNVLARVVLIRAEKRWG